MPSRFDYPDPGCDPAYCNPLSEPPEDEPCCLWCGDVYDVDTHAPYCSAACAVAADRESTSDLDVAQLMQRRPVCDC